MLYRASNPVRIPLPGTVFDYTLDDSTGTFVRWSQKGQERSKNIGGYIVTPEVEKYTFLIELLVNSHQPVLLTGQPGVGKTSLIHVSGSCSTSKFYFIHSLTYIGIEFIPHIFPSL